MRALLSSHRGLLLAIALASVGAVAFAVATQHLADMQPCPWCILQRLIYLTIGAVALAGLAWTSATGARVVAYILLLLCGLGVATALWQHFVAAASASCNLTLADRIIAATGLDGLLPAVFQPTASCADAAVDLLGIPFEFWSVAMFTLLEAATLMLIVGTRRAIRVVAA